MHPLLEGRLAGPALPTSLHRAIASLALMALMAAPCWNSARAGHLPTAKLLVRGAFDRSAALERGIDVGARAGGWSVVRLPLANLALLTSLPGVETVLPSARWPLVLDSAVVDSRVSLVRTPVPGGFVGPTGNGIVIGVVDTGIDLGHADFRRPDGTTRVISLWDQGSAAGTPPAGFSYGTEWDAEKIDAGIAVSADDWGHGTHVAGIAAGNGRGGSPGLDQGRYVGVAPEASLCVVKLDFVSGEADAADVVDAVAYVFAKAASLGMPAVVNLSLGGHQGPHDGTDPFDEMFSALAGPGRIIVAAAGNEGQTPVHGVTDLPAGGGSTMTFFVPSYTPNAGASNDLLVLSGWLDPADSVSVTVTSPQGRVVGPVAAGTVSAATEDGSIDLCVGACDAPAGALTEVAITLTDADAAAPPRSGLWSVRFDRGANGGSGRVDTYTATQSLGEWAPWVTWVSGGVTYGTIRSPATADSVIAVGASVTKACWPAADGQTHCGASPSNVGKRAAYSSRGPRRDGALRPDLVAPGAVVISARSATAPFADSDVVEGGAHAALQGTSMAAPHAAGVVALLLSQEGWRDAGPTRVRDHLRSTARVDGFTGAVPNDDWGYGKLDAAGSLDLTPTAVEPAPARAPRPRLALERAIPNPFNPRTVLSLDVERPSRVTLRVFGPGGALIRTLIDGPLPAGRRRVEWDGRDERGRGVASGVYYVVASAGGETVTRKAALLK